MSVQDFRSRKHRSSARLAVMFAVGALASVAIGLSGNWAYAPSLGWAAASLTYLFWVWSVIGRLSPAATAAHAAREDSGRAVSDALLLTATLASFGGVALILLDAGSAEGIAKAGIVAVALAALPCRGSWSTPSSPCATHSCTTVTAAAWTSIRKATRVTGTSLIWPSPSE